MDTQLFVIGDGHATFWNGTGDWHGANTIPGIRCTAIPGALAWDLSEDISTSNARQAALGVLATALREGYQGWVMLSFGTIDCDTLIWRQTQHLGFEEAVRRVVDRYVAFISTVKSMHTKVAVWGPVSTKKADVDESVIGSEAERNLAMLVFTALVQERLALSGIPVLSIAERLLDSANLSQKMMPQALQLVNETLGLQLDHGELSPVILAEQLADDFAEICYVPLFDKTWLQLTVPEGAQFFTDVSIAPDVFAEVRSLGVATTWDGRNFEYEEVAFENTVADAGGRHRVHIARYARKIFIFGQTRTLNIEELQFYLRGSQIQRGGAADRSFLLTLRDRIMNVALHAPVPTPSEIAVAAATTPEVVFTAPPPAPVETVIFSEPPSMSVTADVVFSEPPAAAVATEVIFSEPPGMAPIPDVIWSEPDYIPTISEAFTNASPVAQFGYDVSTRNENSMTYETVPN